MAIHSQRRSSVTTSGWDTIFSHLTCHSFAWLWCADDLRSVVKLVAWCTYNMTMWQMSGITCVAVPWPLDVLNVNLKCIPAWAVNNGCMHRPSGEEDNPPAPTDQPSPSPTGKHGDAVHMVSGSMAIPPSLMWVSVTFTLLTGMPWTTGKSGRSNWSLPRPAKGRTLFVPAFLRTL